MLAQLPHINSSQAHIEDCLATRHEHGNILPATAHDIGILYRYDQHQAKPQARPTTHEQMQIHTHSAVTRALAAAPCSPPCLPPLRGDARPNHLIPPRCKLS